MENERSHNTSGPGHRSPAAGLGTRDLLRRVRDGDLAVERAAGLLSRPPLEPLDEIACLDHHRDQRTGFGEVVYCEGKTPDQVGRIMVRLAEQRDRVFGTRASRTHYEAVRAELPEAQYHEPAQMVWVDRRPETPGRRGVALVGAGTSDLPVAEEARLALELMGEEPVCLQDVGVAGLHRVVSHLETLQRSNVVIVVAGMEGALPSLVGGLIEAPVIAVPTSVGYGASFGGMAALLSMLNSCAPGVAVVNIDNGFGAGHLAATINRRIAEGDRERED